MAAQEGGVTSGTTGPRNAGVGPTDLGHHVLELDEHDNAA